MILNSEMLRDFYRRPPLPRSSCPQSPENSTSSRRPVKGIEVDSGRSAGQEVRALQRRPGDAKLCDGMRISRAPHHLKFKLLRYGRSKGSYRRKLSHARNRKNTGQIGTPMPAARASCTCRK